MEFFVGLNFKPLYKKHTPLYCVSQHRDGKIKLVRLGTLKDRKEIVEICRGFGVKTFSFNFHYGDGRYKLPKIRAGFYIDALLKFMSEVREEGYEAVPLFSSSVYGSGNLPSGELLEGLNFRFEALEKLISNLDINPFKFPWRVYPVDVLDVIATSVGLYFYSVGRFEFVDFEGFKVVKVLWKLR
jgi:hypothetical protein